MKRIFGQTQVHKINFLCDIHNELMKAEIGDNIQIKIVESLSDDSKSDESTYNGVKKILSGPSLADSFPFIMHGRIYQINYADLQYFLF